MLCLLPLGLAINPHEIKFAKVRRDMKQDRCHSDLVFNAIVKTDEQGFLLLNGFESKQVAATLVLVCARRINAALDEEDPSNTGRDA